MDLSNSATKKTSSFANNFFYQSRFMPEVKTLLAKHILREGTFTEDTKDCTDLTIAKNKVLSIACRIRRHGFYDRYPYEFTIRKSCPSKAKTEFEKIISGLCDIYFYGHASKYNNLISHYYILDMDVFRKTLILANDDKKKKIYQSQQWNKGENSFYAFDVRDFPEEMIIENK